MPKIKNAKILIIATDGFEQSELDVPRQKLAAVAQLVHVAAPKERKAKDSITGWQNHDWGKPVKSTPSWPRSRHRCTTRWFCQADR